MFPFIGAFWTYLIFPSNTVSKIKNKHEIYNSIAWATCLPDVHILLDMCSKLHLISAFFLESKDLLEVFVVLFVFSII